MVQKLVLRLDLVLLLETSIQKGDDENRQLSAVEFKRVYERCIAQGDGVSECGRECVQRRPLDGG